MSGWEKKVEVAAPHHQTFHQLNISRDASGRQSLVGGHKASVVSECHTRPPATRRPVTPALLLFIAAVLIDILGVLDQSMPALDCIYGPASAALMKKLFNSKAGAAVAMVEESVPGLDWIPTATITWCAWTYSCWNAEAKQKKQQAKAKKHDIPVATPVG